MGTFAAPVCESKMLIISSLLANGAAGSKSAIKICLMLHVCDENSVGNMASEKYCIAFSHRDMNIKKKTLKF